MDIRSRVLTSLLVLSLNILALTLGRQSAQAESASIAQQARESWQRAAGEYTLGHYLDAARLFEQSYRLLPDARILFNIGQSYKKVGDEEHALIAYKSFLRNLKGELPQRAIAEKRVDEIEAKHAEQPSSSRESSAVGRVPTGSQIETGPGLVQDALPREHTAASPDPSELSLVALPAASVEADGSSAPIAGEPRARRALEIGAVSVGATGVVVGAVMGLLARSEWNQSKMACGGDPKTCADTSAAGPHETRASLDADVATGAFAVAGACLAIEAILYLTRRNGTPSKTADTALVPTFAPGTASVELKRSF